MAKNRRRQQGGAWTLSGDDGREIGYAVITGEEAFVCGAEILGFHPRNGEALGWIWTDGRIALNACYFSQNDARSFAGFVNLCAARSE